MALTQITRRRNTPPAPRRPRRGKPDQPTPNPFEGLTSAALYDLALHDRTGALAQFNGSLTAAALTVQQRNSQDIRRLIQPWQAESMSYYDLVSEHSFAARFMGQMLSKVRLFPARIDPKTNEPEEITEGQEVDLLERIQGRSGDRSELQRSYAMLKYLIGENYLCAFPDHDREEVWECLSPNELRVQPQGIATRFRAPMLAGDQYIIGNDAYHVSEYGGVQGPEFREDGPDVILVYRNWRPHPAYSFLADCSSKANRLLLEELVLSTYSVKAQLKSRLNTVGALFIPEEASFPGVGNDPDEDPESDSLQQRLGNLIMTAIKDPGTAAAMSPIVVQMAGDFIKDIQHIRFNDNQGELTEISQRTEMIERYGVGAELPPELFKSQADLNHWTGWLVDKTTYDNYGDPAAREMASDICSAYLQPACREAGIADWKSIVIGVDPAEAIYHPNRSQDAIELFDRLQINGEVLRSQMGYNENDVMSQEEKDEQAGLKIKDGSLYRYGIPAVRANIEPEAGDVVTAPEAGDAASQPGPPNKGVVPAAPSTKAPSAGPDATNAGTAVTASGDARAVQLLTLAEAAVQRGRELAGSRLQMMVNGRRGQPKCEECVEAIKGLENWDVASALGEHRVVDLFGPATHGLVEGTGRWLQAALVKAGVSAEWAARLGGLVETHTAGSLFKPVADELPAGFVRLLGRVHLPLERT